MTIDLVVVGNLGEGRLSSVSEDSDSEISEESCVLIGSSLSDMLQENRANIIIKDKRRDKNFVRRFVFKLIDPSIFVSLSCV